MSSIAAVSFKTGQPAPPDLGLGECEDLKDENEKNRAEVVKRMEAQKATPNGRWTEEEERVLNMAKGTGMTFSTGTNNLANATSQLSACSNAVAQSKAPDLLSGGGTSEQVNGMNKMKRHSCDEQYDAEKEKAGVLCDKSHIHPGGGFGGHAEPKIVNDLTNQVGAAAIRGGKMLFNIDWRNKNFNSGMPCQHCYKMLCHAAKECDIKIYICSEGKESYELSADDCEKDGSYSALCMKVDGSPTPGR